MDADERSNRIVLLEKQFEASPLAQTFHLKFGYTIEGMAEVRYPYQAVLVNAIGNTHGGVLATLMDLAGWFAAAVQYDQWITTVDLGVKLIEPTEKENLVGLGWVVRTGKRVAFCQMEVLTESRRRVAFGNGTYISTDRARPV